MGKYNFNPFTRNFDEVSTGGGPTLDRYVKVGSSGASDYLNDDYFEQDGINHIRPVDRINDSGIGIHDLWSADKIIDELLNLDPFELKLQLNLTDDDTAYLAVADMTTHREATIQYTLEFASTNRYHRGYISVIHNGIAAEIIDHQYSYTTGGEEPGISFSADIDTNDLRLIIILSGVGENPKMVYNITRAKLAI